MGLNSSAGVTVGSHEHQAIDCFHCFYTLFRVKTMKTPMSLLEDWMDFIASVKSKSHPVKGQL